MQTQTIMLDSPEDALLPHEQEPVNESHSRGVPLQGGSTMFKDFGRRVQRDVSRAMDARQVAS